LTHLTIVIDPPNGKCENTCFQIFCSHGAGGVKIDPMAHVRPYRGVEAADRVAERRRRFLEAGLDILGSGPDPSELTVRGICGQAGVALRYFYEGFTDKDDFVGAVFDWVIADIAATTQAAVTAAPIKEQSRAGMANIVRTIAADTRVGRLLFSSQLSNPVVVRKRAESGALMAMLLFQHAGSLGAQNNDLIKATSHFAVGGVGQTITAWLAGDITLDTEQLVDQLAAIIDQLAVPELYKG
jgi:AcrR family transcriptional regulator